MMLLIETSPSEAGIRGRDFAPDERLGQPATSDTLIQAGQSQQGQGTSARTSDENVLKIARKNLV